MKNTIIKIDNDEQGWMDSFNDWNSSSYSLNQKIDSKEVEELKRESMNLITLWHVVQRFDWRKRNDLSFYLYHFFHFYVSNHTRWEQEIIGKTNNKFWPIFIK